MSRPTLEEYFTRMATLVATRSTCLRRSVGCVLVDARGHVLSTGYNGVAAGQPHCNEVVVRTFITVPERDQELALLQVAGTHVRACNWPLNVPLIDDPDPAIAIFANACVGATSPSGTDLDRCEAVHAEMNAIAQCRDVYQIDTCYVTTAPCMSCTKLLLNTGCRRIVFSEPYPHIEAKELWEKNGKIWLYTPSG